MSATPPRLLVVGYGRMGRLVDSLAPEYGARVAGRVDRRVANTPDDWPSADVAIDFSTAAAIPVNLPRLAARGMNVVVGTTGWEEHETAMRMALAPVGVRSDATLPVPRCGICIVFA